VKTNSEKLKNGNAGFFPMSGVRAASISLDSGHPGASFLAKIAKIAGKAAISPGGRIDRSSANSRSTTPGLVSDDFKGGLKPAEILQAIFGAAFSPFRFVSRESKRIGGLSSAAEDIQLFAAKTAAIHGRRPLSII
jgi:hypothetical protein